ncbi:MAG: cbb3-type cytochrome c oxidase subunit II [Phycisphaerae bacterium]
MNSTTLITLGVIATVLASLLGLVVLPQMQAEAWGPVTVTNAFGGEEQYPPAYDPLFELPGRQVYISQGCIYCHSQQVAEQGYRADIDRGWGSRRSVPRDYVHDRPPLLGTMRTGPDLANVGTRLPSDEWHHVHLFDPRILSPGSVMPRFGYLYDVKPQQPEGESYRLPDDYYGYPTWIVPKEDASNLVLYLRRLKQEHAFEQVR